jgi:hypothetical protein
VGLRARARAGVGILGVNGARGKTGEAIISVTTLSRSQFKPAGLIMRASLYEPKTLTGASCEACGGDSPAVLLLPVAHAKLNPTTESTFPVRHFSLFPLLISPLLAPFRPNRPPLTSKRRFTPSSLAGLLPAPSWTISPLTVFRLSTYLQ